MAGITGTIKDIQSSRRGVESSPSWIFYNDGFVAATSGNVGILYQEGIIPVSGSSGSAGTSTKVALIHTANSTVLSYEVLSSPVTGISATHYCLAASNTTCNIEQWATNTGTMDGVSINSGQDMDISISAKRNTNTTENAHLTLKFYHRTTGGTETLLDTVELPDLNKDTVYHDVIGTWSVSSNQAFATNELLVLKIIMNNDGIPV